MKSDEGNTDQITSSSTTITDTKIIINKKKKKTTIGLRLSPDSSSSSSSSSDHHHRIRWFLNHFNRISFACIRLARLHTLMAWAIFPAPAIYTVILFHSHLQQQQQQEQPFDPSSSSITLNFEDQANRYLLENTQQRVTSCMRISFTIFSCVMSYRAAGLAWDDLIDREYDAQVSRSMKRPLPAGDISVDGALVYIICQVGLTIILLRFLLPPEGVLTFLVSSILFMIYPFLKRWTHYTQFFGATLIAMGVLQAWIICATLYDPIISSSGEGSGGSGGGEGKGGLSDDWNHLLAILSRDWKKVLPIFLMEFIYELGHELIYGCQV